jgi:hypothetical protein
MDQLQIEGTRQGQYDVDAYAPPYVVFNVDQQRNVAGPFRFRWMAKLALRWLARKAGA